MKCYTTYFMVRIWLKWLQDSILIYNFCFLFKKIWWILLYIF